jgi:hypothetical protein
LPPPQAHESVRGVLKSGSEADAEARCPNGVCPAEGATRMR